MPQFLPKDSEVELTIEVDASRRISCKAYFPHIDETVEHVFESITKEESDADDLELDIEKAQSTLAMIVASTEDIDTAKADNLERQLDDTYEIFQNGRGDSSCRDKILARLREIWQGIDRLQEENEWPKTELALDKALKEVSVSQERYGNEKTAEAIIQFKQQAQIIIKRQDIKLAKDLIEKINSLE